MMTHRIENIVRTSSKSALLFTGGGAHQFRWFVLFSPKCIFFSFAQQTSEKVILGKKEHHERKQKKGDTTHAQAPAHAHAKRSKEGGRRKRTLCARTLAFYTSSYYY
jgi:hypothetical protein